MDPDTGAIPIFQFLSAAQPQPGDPGPGTDLLFFLLFLGLGAFVVLCQNSLVELKDAKLRQRSAADPDDPALNRIARLLERPGRFASACRGAYTFCHLCAVAFLARGVTDLASELEFFQLPFWSTPWGRLLGSVLVVLVGVFFILVFSRGIPRRLAALAPERLAPALSRPAAWIVAIFNPLSWASEKLCSLVLALMGVRAQERRENVTEEELRMMVDVSEETGGIARGEKEMLLGVFDFADRTVDQIMTHRTDVVAVEENASLEEIVEISGSTGFSRIPVVGEEGLDDVQGILNVKDLLPLAVRPEVAPFSPTAYMRQPVYVPESTKCRDLFARLNREKAQIAVVVDEYGGTSGIVTMEDLLESIVGDIQDEYDNEKEEATPLSRGGYTLDGEISLEEAERLLGCSFRDCPDWDEYDTLGGLLIGLLDRIPAPGEHPSLELDGVRFTVQKSDRRQILQVLAEPLPQEETSRG